jgi:hypothetical protein
VNDLDNTPNSDVNRRRTSRKKMNCKQSQGVPVENISMIDVSKESHSIQTLSNFANEQTNYG